MNLLVLVAGVQRSWRLQALRALELLAFVLTSGPKHFPLTLLACVPAVYLKSAEGTSLAFSRFNGISYLSAAKAMGLFNSRRLHQNIFNKLTANGPAGL